MKLTLKSSSKLALASYITIFMPMLLIDSAQAEFTIPNFEFSSQSKQFFQEGNRQLEGEINILNSDLEPIKIKLPSNSELESDFSQSNSLLPTARPTASDRQSEES